MPQRLGLRRLSVALPEVGEGQPLPDRFLLFKRGINATAKGDVLFDAEAAQLVVDAANQAGVDFMIDLEHDSVDEATRLARADAADALGWFSLEVDASGNLWACNVRWNPEGERRLRNRLQRYTSPCFEYDSETGRVVSLINVALCGRPATYNAKPLVAASLGCKPRRKLSMNPDIVKKALEVLASGDANAALELLKEVVTALAGGDSAETPDPAAMAADPNKPQDPTPEQAMAQALSAVFGKTSPGEIVEAVKSLSAKVDALELRDRVLDESARVELVGELVKLGAETPATAWEGEPSAKKPVARLSSEPVSSLRARVAQLSADPSRKREEVKPPTGTLQLSADDAKLAAKLPEGPQRDRFIALRTASNLRGK